MKTHDPNNECLKREYFAFLKEAKRFRDSSLDGVAQAIQPDEHQAIEMAESKSPSRLAPQNVELLPKD